MVDDRVMTDDDRERESHAREIVFSNPDAVKVFIMDEPKGSLGVVGGVPPPRPGAGGGGVGRGRRRGHVGYGVPLSLQTNAESVQTGDDVCLCLCLCLCLCVQLRSYQT